MSKMKVFAGSMITCMLLILVFCCAFCSSLDTRFSYEEYCHDVLKDAEEEGQQHEIPSTMTAADFRLGFHRAFFAGGSPIFNTNLTAFSLLRPENTAFFSPLSVKLAGNQEAQKYDVEGSLLLRNQSRLWSFNRTRVFRQAGVSRRDPFLRPGGMRLTLKGLWVARSGTLCMAGCLIQNALVQTSTRDCQVKAVFRYPRQNTISQPIVKGIIESKREQSDPLFFAPISITGVSEAPYVFRKGDESAENCAVPHANVPANINVWKDDIAVCQFPWYKQPLTVVWDKQCNGQDCSPFKDVTSVSPATLSVENMVCTEGKVRGFFVFNHQAAQVRSDHDIFSIEGVWSTSTGQLCASACYLKGAANGSLAFESQDCDITITLQFPTTLSLLFRYSVIGLVERRKASALPVFKPFSFTGHMDITYGSFGWGRSPPQLEYAYTTEGITQARDKCQASSSQKSKRSKTKAKYPDGQIILDFGFPATLKDAAGLKCEAYFSPVAVNERTNMYFSPSMGVVMSSASLKHNTSKSMNISFDLNFYMNNENMKLLQNTTFPRFPAEGVYDSRTGMLCLTVCRPLTLSKVQSVSKLHGGDRDCEMLVTIQYPPTNPGYFEKHGVSGKVVSLREPSDVLFFGPVSVSSDLIIYQEQALNSLREIDLEIILGIVSLTMAVLFIGLQLRHVKKNPKVLHQMSLLMLTVLTLGHLIPLVLNFEALFSSGHRQNVLQWSGGWLEINEVIVRLMTMLVFLLLIRLFHLSWVSKCEVSANEGPWQMEQGALRICLSFYVLGGVIAMIYYGIKGSRFLDVMKGCAGLTVDFFLFPQVVGNYVWEIQGTVLSSPFYVGMTLVRSLPHIYDILRKLEFFQVGNRRYYYANLSWDFYSYKWDAIIPCGNLLFAVLVFCQQRYGGAYFSISAWRQRRSYNRVTMNPI
eukprot:c23736_g1_i1 orf=579-3350(+)